MSSVFDPVDDFLYRHGYWTLRQYLDAERVYQKARESWAGPGFKPSRVTPEAFARMRRQLEKRKHR